MGGRPRWLLALVLLLAACQGDDPLLVIAGAGELVELQVRDAEDRPVWALVADHPRPLEHLFLGVVPEGYRQTVPEDGSPPRPLLPGEPLELEVVTESGVFLRSGFASGPGTFDTTGWWMELGASAPEESAVGEQAAPPS